jgi:CheY-like chemotaxis protein
MVTTATILIVDDDWLNVEVMQAYLESEGYEIDAVPSGEKALAYLQDKQPDLILMDVRMNGLTGIETTAAIKGDETTQHIPVLLVTAHNEKADIEQAIQAGVDDVLFKPLNAPIMKLRIRTLVRLKKLYDELHV